MSVWDWRLEAVKFVSLYLINIINTEYCCCQFECRFRLLLIRFLICLVD